MSAETMHLPELHIELTGLVKSSNLEAFKSQALTVIDAINTDLQTDEDFASAESTVKWCKSVEERLETAKEQALAQTASISDLFQALDEIRDLTRSKRLTLDKAVKTQKDSIRAKLIMDAKSQLHDHLTRINARLGDKYLAPPAFDFADVIKGFKSVSSMQQKLNEALNQAKVEISDAADHIETNLKAALQHPHLLPDLKQIVNQPAQSFAALLAQRLAAEEKRLADERQRIQAEEQRKAEAKAVAERAAMERQAEAERNRVRREQEAADRAAREARRQAEEAATKQPPVIPTSDQAPTQALDVASANIPPVVPVNSAHAIQEITTRETPPTARDDITDFMQSRYFGDDTMLVRFVLVEFTKFVAARNVSSWREQ